MLALVDTGCVNGGSAQPSVNSGSFSPTAGGLVVVVAGCYASTGDDISTLTITDTLGSVWTPIEILSQLVDGAGAFPPQPLAAWSTPANGASRTVTTAIQNGTGFSHFQARFTLTGQDGVTPVVDSVAVRFNTATASMPITSPVPGCIAIGIVTDWGNSSNVPVAEAGSTTLCALANADIQSSWAGYKDLPAAGASTIGIQALASPTGTLGIALVVAPAADDAANATMEATLPVPTFTSEADAVASASMAAVLPVVDAEMSAEAAASAVMAAVLPVPDAEMGADAIVSATMDAILPMPTSTMGADNEGESPDLFSALAERLRTCLCSQWPDGHPLKPARCCFRFDGDTPTMGIAITEDECKCGTAWVRVVDWYVSSDNTFPGPTEDVGEQNCPMMWALVLEMGIGRCPPTGDQNVLPTCDQLDAFHLTVMDDGKRLRNAIYCCFLAVDPLDRVVVGQPERIGPQGKCFQQTLTVTVMVPACSEC
jgi:hypothetical protein